MNETSSSMTSMVRSFHKKAGYEYESTPSIENRERRELWRELITEEYQELISALDENDIYKVADGIADSLYVLIGAALAFSIPIERVFLEVHKSNLSKIDGKVNWRSDGKVMRSGDYRPPNIKSIIDELTLNEAQNGKMTGSTDISD